MDKVETFTGQVITFFSHSFVRSGCPLKYWQFLCKCCRWSDSYFFHKLIFSFFRFFNSKRLWLKSPVPLSITTAIVYKAHMALIKLKQPGHFSSEIRSFAKRKFLSYQDFPKVQTVGNIIMVRLNWCCPLDIKLHVALEWQFADSPTLKVSILLFCWIVDVVVHIKSGEKNQNGFIVATLVDHTKYDISRRLCRFCFYIHCMWQQQTLCRKGK